MIRPGQTRPTRRRPPKPNVDTLLMMMICNSVLLHHTSSRQLHPLQAPSCACLLQDLSVPGNVLMYLFWSYRGWGGCHCPEGYSLTLSSLLERSLFIKTRSIITNSWLIDVPFLGQHPCSRARTYPREHSSLWCDENFNALKLTGT